MFMIRPVRLRSTTRLIIAGSAAAGLACAGSALAASPYTAKVSVPQYDHAGTSMNVKVSGNASKSVRLAVYLAKGCRKNGKAENAVSGAQKIIDVFVDHTYTRSRKVALPASTATGTYYACAYLGPVTKPYTHPHGTYFVLAGQYPG
jgi:hypothetical protein